MSRHGGGAWRAGAGGLRTALTGLLLDADWTVVDPSPTIAARFDRSFPAAVPAVRVEGTPDREGIQISGESDAVEAVSGVCGDLTRDTFCWPARHPTGALYAGRVEETGDGGAVVDLGDGSAYLPYSRSGSFVREGDAVTVQVIEPRPPWLHGRRPVVTTELRVPGTYLDLAAATPEDERVVGDDRETAGMLELLDPELPEGGRLEARPEARGVGLSVLEEELERLLARMAAVDAVSDAPLDDPGPLDEVGATSWCRFGREGRFALDAHRADATATWDGHHRLKAAGDPGGRAVDLIERLDVADVAFDPDAVLDTFGPRIGDRVRIDHGKPDGRSLVLGRGEVTERPRTGAITVRRELSPGGRLDALDVPKEQGDTADTTFVEGAWWYPTVYRDADGDWKGTYVNICTPLELFPQRVRYVDLYVDVIKDTSGAVRIVDMEELDAAADADELGAPVVEKARAVARAVRRSMS